MTISAESIIQRCVETLQDHTSIRWPVAELVRYLNDGQREVGLHRPDALRKSATKALDAGTRQTIPSDGVKLIDIIRNTGGTKRAVLQVNREILDAQASNWHGMPEASEVLHFMFDTRDPMAFYVYPPAKGPSAGAAAASVDMLYAANPIDVPAPGAAVGDGLPYTGVSGDISVPDIYANVLQDYVLFRAYSKDSEYAGNAERAQNHYTLFANALGIEIKSTVAFAPQSSGKNNAARAVP